MSSNKKEPSLIIRILVCLYCLQQPRLQSQVLFEFPLLEYVSQPIIDQKAIILVLNYLSTVKETRFQVEVSIKSRLRRNLLFFLYINFQEHTVGKLLLNHDNRCS